MCVLMLCFQYPDTAFSEINVDPSSVDTCDEIAAEDADAFEAVEACFEELNKTTNGSYLPFPSKDFALLFFLVNSPHPMVRLFIVHACT